MQGDVGLRDGPGSELLDRLWDWEEGASERTVYLVFSELNQLASTGQGEELLILVLAQWKRMRLGPPVVKMSPKFFRSRVYQSLGRCTHVPR